MRKTHRTDMSRAIPLCRHIFLARLIAYCGSFRSPELLADTVPTACSGQGAKVAKVRRYTPLHAAAASGNVEAVEALIAAGLPLTATTSQAVAAAHTAAAHSAAVLAVLLAAGSPERARDGNRQGLMHHSARAGNVAAMEVILPSWPGRELAEYHLDGRDRWHRTPLHWSVLNGHAAATEWLCAAGASRCGTSVPLAQHRKRTHLRQQAPAAALPLAGSHRLQQHRRLCRLHDAIAPSMTTHLWVARHEAPLHVAARLVADDAVGQASLDALRSMPRPQSGAAADVP